MLDDSGSMGGEKWTNLKSSYGKFVKHLADNEDLKAYSELTVITFASNYNLIYL